MAATTVSKKASVEQFNEHVFNGHEYDDLGEYFTGDVVVHGPAGETVEGIEGFAELLRGYQAAFPDIAATQEECLAEGDFVACRYTYSGTHDGEFMGMEPTGKTATVAGMSMYRFEGGKVAESWVTVNLLGTLQQIGAFPTV